MFNITQLEIDFARLKDLKDEYETISGTLNAEELQDFRDRANVIYGDLVSNVYIVKYNKMYYDKDAFMSYQKKKLKIRAKEDPELNRTKPLSDTAAETHAVEFPEYEEALRRRAYSDAEWEVLKAKISECEHFIQLIASKMAIIKQSKYV